MGNISEDEFHNFGSKFDLDFYAGWKNINFFSIETEMLYELNPDGSVIVTGKIPLSIAHEMFEKFGKDKEPLYHNTKYGVSMDPIMLAVDNYIKRKGFQVDRLADYASCVNDFVSIDNESQYIDYTIIHSMGLLTWLHNRALLHYEIGENQYKLRGMY